MVNLCIFRVLIHINSNLKQHKVYRSIMKNYALNHNSNSPLNVHPISKKTYTM